MDHYFYHHQPQQQEQEEELQQLLNPNSYVQATTKTTQEYSGDHRDRDRFPQWSHEETKEFLFLRSEFDKSFMKTKRNKALWEAISTKLQLKGFSRTPDQCKSKWKNLVTRFKGSESSSIEVEGNKQFPFSAEMRSILSKRKGVQVQEWEEEEEDHDDDQEQEDEKKLLNNTKRRRVEKKKIMRNSIEVESALREFMKQQLEIESKWLEAIVVRENERKLKEEEWRRSMEALQREKMEFDKRWREREEARQARDEARAERRHALIVSILNKLEEKVL